MAARGVALDLLQAVLRRAEPLDDALARDPGLAALDPRDRGLARMVVATALRRLGQIDALIGHCVARPLTARAAAAEDILRLAVAQLLFLRMPPHAVVDTAVALAATRGVAGHKGLVNAVLRRLGREGDALVAAQDAAVLDTPAWLWQAWVGSFGETTARAIAAAHLAEPPLDLTCPDDADGWATKLDAAVLPTGTLRRRETAPVETLPGFAEGAWWIQDAAAALPARLLARDGLEGRRVADLCAAPGGKTAQLAAAGAAVTAVDRADARLDRLAANLARIGRRAEVVAADAATWSPGTPFDAVLLDAPCSGTGTLRRHPDIARLKGPADVARLAGVQAALLANAARLVAPGGTLVYSVCSLQDEEGPAQVAAFLAAQPGFARRPAAAAEIGGLAEAVTPDGDVRTLPCQLADAGGIDGFYIARLQRQA